MGDNNKPLSNPYLYISLIIILGLVVLAFAASGHMWTIHLLWLIPGCVIIQQSPRVYFNPFQSSSLDLLQEHLPGWAKKYGYVEEPIHIRNVSANQLRSPNGTFRVILCEEGTKKLPKDIMESLPRHLVLNPRSYICLVSFHIRRSLPSAWSKQDRKSWLHQIMSLLNQEYTTSRVRPEYKKWAPSSHKEHEALAYFADDKSQELFFSLRHKDWVIFHQSKADWLNAYFLPEPVIKIEQLIDYIEYMMGWFTNQSKLPSDYNERLHHHLQHGSFATQRICINTLTQSGEEALYKEAQALILAHEAPLPRLWVLALQEKITRAELDKHLLDDVQVLHFLQYMKEEKIEANPPEIWTSTMALLEVLGFEEKPKNPAQLGPVIDTLHRQLTAQGTGMLSLSTDESPKEGAVSISQEQEGELSTPVKKKKNKARHKNPKR